MNCNNQLLLIWCRRPDSNRHGTKPGDFKSPASAIPPLRLAGFYCTAFAAVFQAFRSGRHRPEGCGIGCSGRDGGGRITPTAPAVKAANTKDAQHKRTWPPKSGLARMASSKTENKRTRFRDQPPWAPGNSGALFARFRQDAAFFKSRGMGNKIYGICLYRAGEKAIMKLLYG